MRQRPGNPRWAIFGTLLVLLVFCLSENLVSVDDGGVRISAPAPETHPGPSLSALDLVQDDDGCIVCPGCTHCGPCCAHGVAPMLAAAGLTIDWHVVSEPTPTAAAYPQRLPSDLLRPPITA